MTNDSAKGYVIMAMKGLGYSFEDISLMLEELDRAFDLITEEHSEEYYRSLKWQKSNDAKKDVEKAYQRY